MLPIEQELAELERFDCQGTKALTLYLRTDPARDAGWNLHAQVQDVLRPIWDAIAEDRESTVAFQRDVDNAMGAIARIHPSPRSMAVFICTRHLLSCVVPMQFPVVPEAYWDDYLHLRPLLAELDEHEHVLVVMIDKERLRLFRMFMGRIEELADFTDDVPGKHREGGFAQQKLEGGQWSVRIGYDSATIQRHHEWHVRRHLDRVMATLRTAHRDGPVERILLSATPEVRAEFTRLLPRRWRGLVDHQLQIPMHATQAEVLNAALEAQKSVERRGEEELVELLFNVEHASRGAAAVTQAVADAEVLTFVYARDTKLIGSVCPNCGWLMPAPAPAQCGRCATAVQPNADLIDVCIDRVLRQGGRVEEVRGAAADRLRQAEGVGVLCRFSRSVVTSASVI